MSSNGHRKLSNVTITSAASMALSKMCYKKVKGEKNKCRTQTQRNSHAHKNRRHKHTRTGTLAHTHTPKRIYFFRCASSLRNVSKHKMIKQMMLSLFCCRLNNAATPKAKFSDAFNA